MHGKAVILAAVISVAGAVGARGQAPVIASLQGNGQVTWTNRVNTGAVYRIEWAANPNGPWRQTCQTVQSIDAHSRTSFSVAVPMFYRVAMITNAAPRGMVWIDPGEFAMGQTGIAEPVHTNYISGFWIDEMEVTSNLWEGVRAWALTNGYSFTGAGAMARGPSHPVYLVPWIDCLKWCNARSEKEGLTPCYYTNAAQTAVYRSGSVIVSNTWVKWNAGGYRLPTEAEWEKAARGGRQGFTYPWGSDSISHADANYDGGAPFYSKSPVGAFPANGYGLHDMAGNVLEWCWDEFGAYSGQNATDPHGPDGLGDRVIRGGSHSTSAEYQACAYRILTANPLLDYDPLGFRCVR
jgi:sulfatase modifying factor 1